MIRSSQLLHRLSHRHDHLFEHPAQASSISLRYSGVNSSQCSRSISIVSSTTPPPCAPQVTHQNPEGRPPDPGALATSTGASSQCPRHSSWSTNHLQRANKELKRPPAWSASSPTSSASCASLARSSSR